MSKVSRREALDVGLTSDAMCSIHSSKEDGSRVRRCLLGDAGKRGHLMLEERQVGPSVSDIQRLDSEDGVPAWYDPYGTRAVCRNRRHSMFFPFRTRHKHLLDPWQRASILYNLSFLGVEHAPRFDLDTTSFAHSPLTVLWIASHCGVEAARRHVASLPPKFSSFLSILDGEREKLAGLDGGTMTSPHPSSSPHKTESTPEAGSALLAGDSSDWKAGSPETEFEYVKEVMTWKVDSLSTSSLCDLLLLVLEKSIHLNDRYGVCGCCFQTLVSRSNPMSRLPLLTLWAENLSLSDKKDLDMCDESCSYDPLKKRRSLPTRFHRLSLSSLLNLNS